MKKVKQMKGWGIYKNTPKEENEYGFAYTVIHPDNKDVGGLTPRDTDIECDSLTEAENWIRNY